MKDYEIKCPSCDAVFSVKWELNKWKREILKTLKFFEKVKELKDDL